jgi:hypothetical protein
LYRGTDCCRNAKQKPDIEEEMVDMKQQRISRRGFVSGHVMGLCADSRPDKYSLQSQAAKTKRCADRD